LLVELSQVVIGPYVLRVILDQAFEEFQGRRVIAALLILLCEGESCEGVFGILRKEGLQCLQSILGHAHQPPPAPPAPKLPPPPEDPPNPPPPKPPPRPPPRPPPQVMMGGPPRRPRWRRPPSPPPPRRWCFMALTTNTKMMISTKSVAKPRTPSASRSGDRIASAENSPVAAATRWSTASSSPA